MKQAHIYFLMAVFSMLALASCTIESRLYRPGYHVEWHSGKKQPAKVQSEKQIQVVEENAVTTLPETTDQSTEPTMATSGQMAMELEKVNPAEKVADNVSAPPKVQARAKKSMKNDESSSETNTIIQPSASASALGLGEATSGSSGALRTIGWILIILGIVLLLLVSIVTGLLTMLVGLLFVIVGG